MEISSLNEEEVLRDKLETAVEEYFENPDDVKNRKKLLKVLENNECREVISKCVDGDSLSNAFANAGGFNHLDILQAFLDHGMNVDIKDKYGWTALMNACVCGNQELVRLLLNKNANPNAHNSDGWTPLMSTTYYGHREIVQLLLDYNADIDLKDGKGLTALDVAKTQEIKEMIQNHVNTSYVLK